MRSLCSCSGHLLFGASSFCLFVPADWKCSNGEVEKNDELKRALKHNIPTIKHFLQILYLYVNLFNIVRTEHATTLRAFSLPRFYSNIQALLTKDMHTP